MPGFLGDFGIAGPGTLLLRDLIAIDMRRDPASHNSEHQYQADACQAPSVKIHDSLQGSLYAEEQWKASDYFTRRPSGSRRGQSSMKWSADTLLRRGRSGRCATARVSTFHPGRNPIFRSIRWAATAFRTRHGAGGGALRDVGFTHAKGRSYFGTGSSRLTLQLHDVAIDVRAAHPGTSSHCGRNRKCSGPDHDPHSSPSLDHQMFSHGSRVVSPLL
jgi:hypothetical protein